MVGVAEALVSEVKNVQIILASASPRRQELLRQVGVSFRIVPSSVDETVTEIMLPGHYVEHLAVSKATAVATLHPGNLVIGADTTVVLDGDLLNKPANRTEAILMLERLSGRGHDVYTGIAIVRNGQIEVSHERTTVHFRELSRSEIERYVDTSEPMDKAGAYAIQGLGAVLVKSIEGDYFNVVGLPICRLAQMLSSFGVTIL